jgi:hypothetical protein
MRKTKKSLKPPGKRSYGYEVLTNTLPKALNLLNLGEKLVEISAT